MATATINRPQVPLTAKLLCSVQEACSATGFSAQTLYRWMNDGRLESRLVQRRRRIVVASLLKILELEPDTS
jgi:hypothetical protein